MAVGTPAALYLRHQWQGWRRARTPFPGVCLGSRRTAHVSRPRPTSGVCHARLDAPAADVRAYVASLEEWIIRTLASFEVCAERRHDRVGVWVARSDKGAGCEDKIAAIGVRLRRWVSFHGISINVEPNLSHFEAIVPCGVSDARFGVTSLADLGRPIPMAEVDLALRRTFPEVFGPMEERVPESRSDMYRSFGVAGRRFRPCAPGPDASGSFFRAEESSLPDRERRARHAAPVVRAECRLPIWPARCRSEVLA